MDCKIYSEKKLRKNENTTKNIREKNKASNRFTAKYEYYYVCGF